MRLAAVSLCDLSFFVGDQTLKMESLFKGSPVFSGFFPASCGLRNAHLIMAAMAVSQHFKTHALLCRGREKKKKGQTISRDVINNQICLQLRGLADSCDWMSAPCGRGRHPSVPGQKEITGQIYHFIDVASTKASWNTHGSPSEDSFSKIHQIILSNLLKNRCEIL